MHLSNKSLQIVHIIFITYLIIFYPIGYSEAKDTNDSYIKIGVLALNNIEDAYNKWSETARYLTANVRPYKFKIVPLSFSQLEDAVKNKSVDYLIVNPYQYIEIEAKFKAFHLLTLKRAYQNLEFYSFGGVIFTKSDKNNINKLSDIKGKTFAAVSPNSLGGWLIAKSEFLDKNVDPESDFRSVRFFKSHVDVVNGVINGLADAGTVRTGIIEEMLHSGKLDIKDIKVLNKQVVEDFPYLLSSRLYPEWPFAALKHVDKKLSNRIVIALLSLTPESPAAKHADIAGWTIPLNYQAVHELMKQLNIGIYKDYGKVTFLSFIKQNWGVTLLVFIMFIGTYFFAMYIWELNKKLVASNAVLTHEISEKKRIAEELKTTNDFTNTVLQSLKDSIAVIDVRDFKILSINNSFAQEIGLDISEIRGKYCYKITHNLSSPCSLPEHNCPLFETLKTGAHVSYEHIHYNSKGERFYVEVSTSPIFDSAGKVTQVVHISRNITDRKLYELELQKSKELAEAASASKSRFLANISHEIRTPMNAIVNMTDIVLESDISNAQRQNLMIIKDASKSLLSLLNDILDISRIESGKLQIVLKPFSLRHLIDSVSSLFSASAYTKGIALSCFVSHTLPDTLLGDELRLRQILSNLLGNAIKFTEKGSVALNAIDKGTEGDSVNVSFEVVDTGIGIDEHKLQSIFETFVQLDDSLTRKYGGSGLGLAISNELVKLMGGILQVQSNKSIGSRFYFTIKLSISHQQIPVDYQDKYLISISQKSTKKAIILVVEDNEINQQIALKLLTKAGYQVDIADNGLQAIEKLKNKAYDLVLMDIQMPEMDGFVTTNAIRNGEAGMANANIAIIALTAHAMPEDKDRCINAGMNGYITKPINANELYKIIQDNL